MGTEEYYHSLRGLYQLPQFIINEDDRYIIVEGSDDNIKKWNEHIKQFNEIKENIYFYEPDDYKIVLDKLIRESEEAEKARRQEAINNPKVDSEILNIKSKNELVDFLLDEYASNEFGNVWEYSTDIEVSEARVKAEVVHLRNLAKQFR